MAYADEKLMDEEIRGKKYLDCSQSESITKVYSLLY